jgi:hypothetical protein
MNVHSTEFARQYQSYKEIRARLFGPAKPVVAAIPAPKPVIKVLARTAIPLWQIVDLNFDWHVTRYREVVRQCLERMAAEEPYGVPVPIPSSLNRRKAKDIIAEVLENFPGIKWSDLQGYRRTRAICLPRQIAMYQVHVQRKDMSSIAIGRLFGGRDHTTVLHAVHKVEKLISTGELQLPYHDEIIDFE